MGSAGQVSMKRITGVRRAERLWARDLARAWGAAESPRQPVSNAPKFGARPSSANVFILVIGRPALPPARGLACERSLLHPQPWGALLKEKHHVKTHRFRGRRS